MVGATVGDCEVPFKRSQQFYEVVPRMPAAEFAGFRVSLCIQGRIAEVGRLRSRLLSRRAGADAAAV